ncbi:PilZ domain-containing protein [Marinobacter sp. CA1]|uniref:PilZ domain-containing protein n=1 Tax=Marinobacter sp. CA1 TaxID=2817656 RepID=UPI001D069BD2|nr:PilZ domain-containing protein [Marinobacter sp. CA1]UDL07180.1 PilZ domain-containing protein [Marinobacter sp. CA1]
MTKSSSGARSASEQRSEYRLTGRARVRLELEAADDIAGYPAKYLESWSTDLSTNGARLTTDQSVPIDALLPVSIRLQEGQTAHNLTAEVIWSNPLEDGRWTVGLRFLESEDADYLCWIEAMAVAMVED